MSDQEFVFTIGDSTALELNSSPELDVDVRVNVVPVSTTVVGISDDIKQALLNCFQHVAWIDEHGQDYYDTLYSAFYPPVGLVGITAVYTQSGTVYDTDTLDDLKPDLVVTALYSDSTSAVITSGYTLSGTLTAGTSTITVAYQGQTTTFTVTVESGIQPIPLNYVSNSTWCTITSDGEGAFNFTPSSTMVAYTGSNGNYWSYFDGKGIGNGGGTLTINYDSGYLGKVGFGVVAVNADRTKAYGSWSFSNNRWDTSSTTIATQNKDVTASTTIPIPDGWYPFVMMRKNTNITDSSETVVASTNAQITAFLNAHCHVKLNMG